MNGILTKKEKEELLQKEKEVIVFSTEKMMKEYGSFFTEEQLKWCKSVQTLNHDEIMDDFSLTDIMIAYLSELHHMGIYESMYLLNDYNTMEAEKEVKESIHNPLSKKMHIIHYQATRKTFLEYALGMAVRLVLSKLILTKKEEAQDVFTNSFEKGLREGMIELYARKFCFNESYQKEFKKRFGYDLPTTYLYLYENNLTIARMIDEGVEQKMIFQSSFQDILKEYPYLKQRISLESLKEMKKDYIEQSKTEFSHSKLA